MNDWVRGKSNKSVYKGNMKLTPQRAIEKLEEITVRRLNPKLDHSSTIYFDINHGKIYTGTQGKFSNRSNNTEDQERDPEKLRHNETHVKAKASDIEGFFYAS
jgi:hypothetical protein